MGKKNHCHSTRPPPIWEEKVKVKSQSQSIFSGNSSHYPWARLVRVVCRDDIREQR